MDYARLLAFGSTHRALKAEAVLKAEGVGFRLLPSPKEFAAYCALVIGVGEEDMDRAVALLEKNGLAPKMILQRKDNGYVKM